MQAADTDRVLWDQCFGQNAPMPFMPKIPDNQLDQTNAGVSRPRSQTVEANRPSSVCPIAEVLLAVGLVGALGNGFDSGSAKCRDGDSETPSAIQWQKLTGIKNAH